MQATIKKIKLKVADIKKNPRNPKKHDDALIEQSIKEFGVVAPIIVDEGNMILAGHGRLDALRKLGYEEVEVVVKEGLTQKQKEKYLLLDNKLTELGGWDTDLLAEFDENILSGIGWEGSELDEIFGLETAEEFDVDKELAKIQKQNQKRVRTGEVWQLGEHRLAVGNATDPEIWKRLLGNERFEFLFTDPPYRISYAKRFRKVSGKNGRSKKSSQRLYESVGETDKQGKPIKPKHGFGSKGNRIYEGIEIAGGVPEYDQWLSLANQYQDAKGVNVMIFESWKNTVELWQAVEKYWKVKNMVIWHTPNRHQGFGMRRQFFSKYDIAHLAGERSVNGETESELDNYLQEHGQKVLDSYDVILFGSQGDSPWSKEKGSSGYIVSDHITANVGSAKETGTNLIFGTKPLSILVPYVKILSERGGIVMEPFGGSGSTLIASEIMKRKCYAIELSETYAEVILNRFEKFTGKEAVKLAI